MRRTKLEEENSKQTSSPIFISGSLLSDLLATVVILAGIVGIAVLLVSLNKDTTVETPTSYVGGVRIESTRVNNIGLMQDKQNGIIIGLGILFGVALVAINASIRKRSSGSAVANTHSAAAEIARFAELREQGIITEDEFQAKKRQLLGM